MKQYFSVTLTTLLKTFSPKLIFKWATTPMKTVQTKSHTKMFPQGYKMSQKLALSKTISEINQRL